MICQGCGQPLEAGVRFCPKCGAQVVDHPMGAEPVVAGYGAPPPPPPSPPMYAMRPGESRVRRHIQVLGVLWLVYGAYRAIFGLMGMFFLRAMSLGGFGYGDWPMHRGFDHFGLARMGALLPFVALMTVMAAALAFVVGFSLLNRKPWGRVLGIVIGILTLIKFPIGTALGIYTLWVLAPGVSGAEYEAIADRG